MAEPAYRRVIVKLSGEALLGNADYGIDPAVIKRIAAELRDVQALGTDFLVSSSYKWFGPHLGALYGREEVLDRLPAYKVRPAHDRFETGTQNHEAIAGVGVSCATQVGPSAAG